MICMLFFRKIRENPKSLTDFASFSPVFAPFTRFIRAIRAKIRAGAETCFVHLLCIFLFCIAFL